MEPLRVTTAPPKPLILFDGDCSFCRRWANRWQGRTGDAVDYESYQCAAVRFPEIPKEQFESATTLIEPDGRVFNGAQAIFRALAAGGFRPWLRWSFEHIPPFAAIANVSYGLISNHRGAADFWDKFLFGKTTAPPTYVLTRSIFLRLLGGIFLFAFLSLWTQIDGLIGSHGIQPVQPFLNSIFRENGTHGYYLLPTLLWIGGSDHALHVLCAAGTFLSCMLILGILPVFTLIGLWACYLSLACGGQVFLGYQWDSLLIEAGFLAIFLSPMELLLWRVPRRPPSGLALFLLRWLLFRVMFMSGVVKLSSGDPSWRAWTAMNFHYQTQPLPSLTSWYFHHLPQRMQSLSVGVMFFAELVAPFLIFGPRRFRRMAFWIIALFQSLIAASGNFGFFNLLTIVLCVTLLDDPFWPRWMRPKSRARHQTASWLWPLPIVAPLAVVVLIVTSIQIRGAFGSPVTLSDGLERSYERISAFRSINPYGLFAVMTTIRPEIIVEGSDDGEDWKPYGFKWKPGDLARRPAFCTPHMPRVDWQMWFAALGRVQNNRWFVYFLGRLLEGTPEVLELLESNPFPDHPPRLVRAVLYKYDFTTEAEHKATGNWWKREPVGYYCPPVDLDLLKRAVGPNFPEE